MLIQKNNFEFVNFFKCLKDIVEQYEFNKNKINLDIFKNFIEDYELKKYHLDVEIEKRRIKDILGIDLQKSNSINNAKNESEKWFKSIDSPKVNLQNFMKQNYISINNSGLDSNLDVKKDSIDTNNINNIKLNWASKDAIDVN